MGSSVSRPFATALGMLVLAFIISLPAVARAVPGEPIEISWTAPTTNDDGSPLTDLAGFRLYRGVASAPGKIPARTYYAAIPAGTTSYTDHNITVGKYYDYSLTAVNADGVESDPSNTLANIVGVRVGARQPTPSPGDPETPINPSRAACSAQSGGVSRLTLVNKNLALLVDPDGRSVESHPISPASKVIMGDFNPVYGGPKDFGLLELAQIFTGGKNGLQWNITSSVELDQFYFGAANGKPLGCYADADKYLDPAVWNKSGFSVMRSTDGVTNSISFAGFGQVLDAACADLTNDGIDELIVLHTKAPLGSNARPGSRYVSTFDLVTKNVSGTTAVDMRASKLAIADTSGTGAKQRCFAYKAGTGRSAISCLDGGKKRLLPIEIKELMTGRFVKTGSADGFAVLSPSGKLYKLATQKSSFQGQQIVNAPAGIPETGNLALHLVQCR